MLLAAPPMAAAPVVVIGEDRAIEVGGVLRAQGVKAEIAFQNGLKNGLKYANRIAAKWAVLANVDGLVLKNLEDGSQSEVGLDDLVAKLRG
jgi:histidyl-tRNA synthetase